MADGNGKQPLPFWLAPLVSIIGAAVVVSFWGAGLTGEINTSRTVFEIHRDRAGHEEMLRRERTNATAIQRLQWQNEQMRKELDEIRRACPEINKRLNPT